MKNEIYITAFIAGVLFAIGLPLLAGGNLREKHEEMDERTLQHVRISTRNLYRSIFAGQILMLAVTVLMIHFLHIGDNLTAILVFCCISATGTKNLFRKISCSAEAELAYRETKKENSEQPDGAYKS